MDAIIDGDVASSHLSNWHSINWKATSCAVSRMQARIAKAAKDKQWRRVTRLQSYLSAQLQPKQRLYVESRRTKAVVPQV